MRSCGIFMPIFSLPSEYGIGTLGREAYRFVDFLDKAGQSYWQILPINPTSYGDSPYQSFSSFAGNPYFIDIQLLIDEGLLTKTEADSYDFGTNAQKVDYEKLYNNRIKLLSLAFSRFSLHNEYLTFCKENEHWLNDYALFMALKQQNEGKPFNEWALPIRKRESEAINIAVSTLKEEIELHKFIQFKFFEQWFALKEYANKKGIKIIGDIPIYAAMDSADVWSCPEQFLLDNNLKPTRIAGCPPDAFSDDGQLWGNPIYNWTLMKNQGYTWWIKRLGHALKIYDTVRIDHFRGFQAYFSIPYGDENAKNGFWEKGPDIEIFDIFKKEFGNNLPIIAEDLGYLTEDVFKLLKQTGFAGMNVLQFAFSTDEESRYLPHNIIKNSVIYTGTHDNDTINGWLLSGKSDEVEYAKSYLNIKHDEDFCWSLIKAALMSVSDTCILMMPDLIGLDSKGRINTPATLGENWVWRITGDCINDWLAKIIYDNTKTYCRTKKSLEE